MAQTSCADAYRGGAGQKLGQRHLHRVVRRESGVGEWRGGHRIQAFGDMHEETRIGDEHVLGLPAVDAETAAERRSVAVKWVVAVGVLTAITCGAMAAAPRTKDGHGCSDQKSCDALADLVHVTGRLMAKRERRAPREHAVAKVMHEVQVGVAQAGAGHLDDHLAGPGFGDVDLDELGLGVPREQLDSLHCSSQNSWRRYCCGAMLATVRGVS